MSNDAVFKSTKVQIPDFPAVAQATPSHLDSTLLQADYAVNTKDGKILTNV